MSEALPFHSLRLSSEDASHIFLSWEVSNICNQSCSYCPDHLHAGDNAFPENMDGILRLLDEIQARNPGKRLQIELAGGEPTLWKHFDAFLGACEARQIRVDLISNGSRRLEWWAARYTRLNMISLSFHTEFANAEHFTKVIGLITEKKSLRVHLLALPDKVHELHALAQDWSTRFNGLSVILKGIRPKFGNEWSHYRADEWEVLSRVQSLRSADFANRPGEVEIRSRVRGNDGKVYKTRDLIYNQRNRFKGWSCAAGLLNFYITNDGQIYRGACRSGGAIGNIYSSWELPRAMHRCEQELCFCLPDLMLDKQRELNVDVEARI